MSTAPSAASANQEFKRQLRQRHLEQLRSARVIPNLPAGFPWTAPKDTPSFKEQIIQWTEDAQAQIAKAKETQVVSPETIDWDLEVFTLLESATVDLRRVKGDTQKVSKAVACSKETTRMADDMARDLLDESESDMEEIARLWGLEFAVVCDLLEDSPVGDKCLSGPYCGAFYSTNPAKPFLGIVFKGTNFGKLSEVLVDLSVSLVEASSPHLWGTPVHNGFYKTLFNEFNGIGEAPISYIKKMIDIYAQTIAINPDVITYFHIAGHSLGGAYATMLFAELMREYNRDRTSAAEAEALSEESRKWVKSLKAKNFVLGDLYTFGSPRVGGRKWLPLKEFAKEFQDAAAGHNGRVWRVVNSEDPISDVPPLLFKRWTHVDNGYQVFPDKAPEALPSEVGESIGINLHIRADMPHHAPLAYFVSLYYAATGVKLEYDYIGAVMGKIATTAAAFETKVQDWEDDPESSETV